MIRLLELGPIPLVLCRPWSPSNWPTGPLNLDGGRKEACPVKCVGVMSRVWATLLALYVMKIKYSDKEEEWELVATEAEGWLKKQSLPSDLTLEQQVFKNG